MIRKAIATDIDRVVEIYNQAILAGFQTADTETFSIAEKQVWFNTHLDSNYPILVAEDQGVVRGWLSISPYRAGRKALEDCVEISYYVDHAFQGKGIGSALVRSCIEVSANLNIYSLIAIILDRNQPSINLMKKLGFTQWGHLPDIASFAGERCGHVYYGLHIK
jgi:L-amino acid N-acyltransferase YncA